LFSFTFGGERRGELGVVAFEHYDNALYKGQFCLMGDWGEGGASSFVTVYNLQYRRRGEEWYGLRGEIIETCSEGKPGRGLLGSRRVREGGAVGEGVWNVESCWGKDFVNYWVRYRKKYPGSAEQRAYNRERGVRGRHKGLVEAGGVGKRPGLIIPGGQTSHCASI